MVVNTNSQLVKMQKIRDSEVLNPRGTPVSHSSSYVSRIIKEEGSGKTEESQVVGDDEGAVSSRHSRVGAHRDSAVVPACTRPMKV